MDRDDPVFSAHLRLLKHFLGTGSVEKLRPIVLGAPNAFARQLSSTIVYRDSIRSLGEDLVIRSLFPETGDPVRTIISPVLGIGLDARILPAGFLASAVLHATIRDLPLNEETLTPLLAGAITQMRSIATEGVADCLVAIAFDGFTIGEPIEAPVGRLSAATNAWPYLTSGHDTCSAEATATLRVHIGSPSQADLFEDLRQLFSLADDFRAAVVVGADAEPPIRPITKLVTIVHPYIGFIGMVSPNQNSVPLAAPRALSAVECEIALAALRTISKPLTTNIAIAFSRILSAIADRASPADKLIDAVTAWENLVGTSSETSFRVCAAMAYLLEPAAELRHETLRSLRRIYQIRSKVVHGEQVPADAVRDASVAAIQAAQGALRCVLLRHEWLVGLPTSEERANALLLGDPRYGLPPEPSI